MVCPRLLGASREARNQGLVDMAKEEVTLGTLGPGKGGPNGALNHPFRKQVLLRTRLCFIHLYSTVFLSQSCSSRLKRWGERDGDAAKDRFMWSVYPIHRAPATIPEERCSSKGINQGTPELKGSEPWADSKIFSNSIHGSSRCWSHYGLRRCDDPQVFDCHS